MFVESIPSMLDKTEITSTLYFLYTNDDGDIINLMPTVTRPSNFANLRYRCSRIK